MTGLGLHQGSEIKSIHVDEKPGDMAQIDTDRENTTMGVKSKEPTLERKG